MKKVMFGLACAAAMVACADIESSNIVGYTNKEACQNYSLAVAMFNAVGSTGIALQGVIPTGENVAGDGSVNLQTFTADAGADMFFSWYTEDEMGFEDGWYDDSFEKSDKVLSTGEGFMVGSAAGAIQLNFSGEVDLTEKVVECGSGYTLVGNFRPVALSLQDIVPQGDASGDGSISLQTFTSEAGADEFYSWYTEADMGFEDGWYDDSFEKVDRSFTPGEGFMIGAGDAVSLKFPAVTIK